MYIRWIWPVIILFSLNCIGNEAVMYRWKDANQVEHFSQIPPQNVEFEIVSMSGKPLPANADTPIKPKTKAKLAAAPPPDVQQNCEKSQLNLQLLQGNDAIYIELTDGSKQLLDKMQIQQQTELAEKQIAFYCASEKTDSR